MASSLDFAEFVAEQLKEAGDIGIKKMFGEYMIYVNAKPVVIICDDVAMVKMLDDIKPLMEDADTRHPYDGAKLHYVLDVDDKEKSLAVVKILEQIIPVPKPRKKKQ